MMDANEQTADIVPDAFIDLAKRMADAARPIVMRHFRKPIDIIAKSDDSPVTIADREAETVMRDLIEATFPDHGILGEEHGSVRLDAEYVWVLDPIDGTKSFITGKPLFGTLIGLARNKVPVMGVLDAPATGEQWIGATGHASTLNGNPATVRTCPSLDQAWLYATSPQMFEGANFDAFERLRLQSRGAVYGADCYAYGLLANGNTDVVCEATMQPYDYCALVPVVQGAGGVITDWSGDTLTIESDGRVLAAGDADIHQAALNALNG